jgi:hypothetical protein
MDRSFVVPPITGHIPTFSRHLQAIPVLEDSPLSLDNSIVGIADNLDDDDSIAINGGEEKWLSFLKP